MNDDTLPTEPAAVPPAPTIVHSLSEAVRVNLGGRFTLRGKAGRKAARMAVRQRMGHR